MKSWKIFIIVSSATSILASLPSALADCSFFALFNFDSIAFGTLQPGISDIQSHNPEGNYNITVETNCSYQINGSATPFTNGSYSFNQSNMKVDTDASLAGLSVLNAVAMGSSTGNIDTDIPESVSTLYVGAWLSIPHRQYPALYSSTLTLTVSNE
jgi:hypothetical protein